MILKKLFDASVDLASQIVENGGEISRAEETVYKICSFAGASEVNVFIIPSLIYASAVINGQRYSSAKRIYKNEMNLGALEEANNISRKICRESYNEKPIDYNYSLIVRILCTVLATASFCIYFGGTPVDAIFSGLSGILIGNIPYKNREFNIFSKTLIEATASAALAFLPLAFGISVHPDKIMIGTIMLFIPGMSIGSSIRDLMSGNLVAGILQLTEALFTALAIALGYSAVLILTGGELFG